MHALVMEMLYLASELVKLQQRPTAMLLHWLHSPLHVLPECERTLIAEVVDTAAARVTRMVGKCMVARGELESGSWMGCKDQEMEELISWDAVTMLLLRRLQNMSWGRI